MGVLRRAIVTANGRRVAEVPAVLAESLSTYYDKYRTNVEDFLCRHFCNLRLAAVKPSASLDKHFLMIAFI